MRRVRELIRGSEPYLIIGTLVLLFFVVLLWERIFVVIPPGYGGVKFRPLFGGTVIDHLYGPGLHLTFPWDRMYSYNLRVQETMQTLTALTQDGLSVTLDLSIRYHPDPSMVGLLHEAVGPDYVNSVVVPEVLSVVREETGERTAEQLVTGRREEPPPVAPGVGIAAVPTPPTLGPETEGEDLTLAQIVQGAGDAVSRKYVIVDAVVLVKTTLPEKVRNAIEEKIERKQYAAAQLYRLQAAQTEVAIKAQEALANTTLRDSIDANLLAWKGIEATRELAASPNSKMIFIGNRADSLPVVLSAEPRP